MTAYRKARDLLSADQLNTLDTLHADWESAADSVHSFASKNLQNDHSLANSDFGALLVSVINAQSDLRRTSPNPAQVFESATSTYTFKGTLAARFTNALLGRAVLLDKYARRIGETLAALPKPLRRVEDFPTVRATLVAISGSLPSSISPDFGPYFEAIRRTAVGRDLVFATFHSPAQPQLRPWPSPPPNAARVRAEIALGEDEIDKPYVLLTYTQLGGEVRVPSAASPGWSYQRWFRPNSNCAVEQHGWTSPLDSVSSKRPEIVHRNPDQVEIAFPITVAHV